MTHIREHRSLLASAEKRLLVWMAARLPSFIRSDHLTAAALAAMLGAGVAFALIARSPVSLGVFRVSFAGVGPTELRIVLAIGAAKVAITPWVEIAGHRLLLLDAGGALACAGLAATFLVSAVRNGASLHATEPVPVPVVRAYRASARRDDRVAAGDPLCSPGS